MIKKTTKKTTKTSKKPTEKPSEKPSEKQTIQIEIPTSENTEKKDIKITCSEGETNICEKKRQHSLFRILIFLLLLIGLLWFAQFKFFAKNMTSKDFDFGPQKETSSDEEIIDIQTGELVDREADYSSKIEELKREDMPDRISMEVGELNEDTFNGESAGELKEPFENNQDIFKSKNKEANLAEMEARLAESNKKIEELTKELEKTNIEIQKASAGYYSAPLVIKLLNLKEKIGTGESFHTDLDDLEYFANGDPIILKAISDIRKYADGLKTKAFINEEFQKSAIEVMKLYNAPAEDASFLSKIMYNLTKNIVIRKTDESRKPSETEQILINAEKALNKEKYKEAVLEIIKLDSKYSESFNEWVNYTSEFVYVDEVLYQAIKYAEEKK